MRKYYPYKATDGKHKYYIITNANKKVYFGAVGYDDFTTHKDPLRKERYIARHKNKEDWTRTGINSAGWLLPLGSPYEGTSICKDKTAITGFIINFFLCIRYNGRSISRNRGNTN